MTVIKKLEMKGFKSFGNKVELEFGNGFNCVLGPNGSGKSNVLDALCFVLGKAGAKGLRAEKTGNLVYNGGKSKTPAKFAEVSIYFTNYNKEFPIEGQEIKISRILKPSGQSKYKINDKNVTRGQIIELLSAARINPDGYNIILQGQITQMIEMSSDQRRKMIEEIAGISVYEDKKKKSLSELGRVEQRVNEAEVILAERDTYLKELKKDRNQAMKFKELDDKIKKNKLTVLTYKSDDSKNKVGNLGKQLTRFTDENKKADETIKTNKNKIQEKNKEITAINHEIEEKGEKDQVALHKEVEKLKVDLALNKQRIITLNSEIEKISTRKLELESTKSEIKSKLDLIEKQKKDKAGQIKSKEQELKNLEKAISDFRKKNSIDGAAEVDKQITELDNKSDNLQEELHKLREEQQNVVREKDRVEIMLQSIDEKIEKVLDLSKKNKDELNSLKAKKEAFKKITKELSTALSENSSLALQLNNARSKLLSRKEDESKLRARSSSIRESLAGGTAIRSILDNRAQFGEVFGTVSDLGNVKSKYALALEVAAGGRIKSVVVNSADTAAKCIKFLKEKRLGIATFLPMNKINAPLIKTELRNMKQSGIHGLAIDLIDYQPKFKKIFSYVFGNTLVVDDIDTARKIGIGGTRMVTLTGDLVETSGAMRGGHRVKQRGLGFQEKEVSQELEKLEKEINNLEIIISSLEQKRSDNEELIQKLRVEKAGLEGDIIKLEKTLHIDSEDLDASKKAKENLAKDDKELDKKLDEAQEKISDKLKELTQLKIKKQELREKISRLNNPTKIAELNTLEEKRTEFKMRVLQLQGEIKNFDSEASSILIPEIDNIEKILKQHSREDVDFVKEKKSLDSLIKSQERELGEKEKKEKKFYTQFKELFTKRSKISEEVSKLENKVFNNSTTIKVNEAKINAINLDSARIKAEIAGLEQEMKQYEGVEPFKEKEISKIEREIRQFEKLAQDMGAVNMKALEIYDQAMKEFKILQDKKKSLAREKEDVLVLINEIDSKKSELFMVTYDVINKNFKRIFSSLNTKGDASIYLENPQDIFEAGLSIKVRLKGKRFLDIRSLSGGEKTLTALAFLFAVQEHEPASFYVLDEVDAALDKRNSEKLAQLISDYSHKAQYVVISHNDSVITEAENLYGVSMNEHGISKVTTLRL
jgi:chromosome segregation protein